MGLRVGIDLGTTFSAVSYINKSGKAEIIKNEWGNNITPSVLCFTKEKILYGEDAKEEQTFGNPNAIAFFKRQMGDRDYYVEFFDTKYNSEDLSTILLKSLISGAEKVIQKEITDAVITVPAYFDSIQREATMRAGKKAGINVICIINEPTAAVFAYGLNSSDKDMTVLVYDLGGGTFDVTIARVTNESITVLGTDGNHQLGGKDWDDAVAMHIAAQFQNEHGIDILENTELFNELIVSCEEAKKRLTTTEKATINVHCEGVKGKYSITREEFNEITESQMMLTRSLTEMLINDINISENGPMSWDLIDGTLLVGGSTRMRMISDYVQEMSGKKPLKGVNVDEAVALGAAIRANIDLEGENIILSLPPSSSNDNSEPLMYIKGAKAINDAIAHSLGMISVSEDGNRFVNRIIIKKNKPIPSIQSRPFTIKTKRDGSSEIEVYMLQGEVDEPLECTVLGKYVFSGLQHITKDKSIIDISYSYTMNGTVDVSAVQRETGKELNVRIEDIPKDMTWVLKSPKEIYASQQSSIAAVIAVDLSGSMAGTPLEKAKKAAHEFVENMDLNCTSIGVMIFADTVSVLIDNTRKINQISNAINSWRIDQVGIGNSAEPFDSGLVCLKHAEADAKYMIVLTDGVWYNQERAITNAHKCHKAGIEVVAIGFGGADEAFLRKIASTDDIAIKTDLNNLSSSFSTIAQAITENESGSQLRLL